MPAMCFPIFLHVNFLEPDVLHWGRNEVTSRISSGGLLLARISLASTSLFLRPGS